MSTSPTIKRHSLKSGMLAFIAAFALVLFSSVQALAGVSSEYVLY